MRQPGMCKRGLTSRVLMGRAWWLPAGLAILSMALLGGCLPTDRTGTPPGIPTGVAATEGAYADKVVITWNAVPGARSYRLERADDEQGPYTTLADVQGTTYEDAAVVPGNLYWYRVRACSEEGLGCSAASARARGQAGERQDEPPPPSGDFVASQGTYDDRIVVGWEAVAGATSYRLYRADDVTGPFEDPLDTLGGTRYDDLDQDGNRLQICQSYWYRLQACGAGGCEWVYGHAEGWRGARIEKGDKVEGLQASNLEFPDRIRLTWEPHPGASAYTIFRGDKDNEIGTSETNSYDDIHSDDNQLEAYTWYRYWVRAEPHPGCSSDDSRPSELSSQAEGRANALPGTPVDLSTSAQADRVTLRWQKGTAIVAPERYMIYRALARGGSYAEIEGVDAPTLQYTDRNVAAGQTYWYKVRAVNAWGESDLSSPIGAAVD